MYSGFVYELGGKFSLAKTSSTWKRQIKYLWFWLSKCLGWTFKAALTLLDLKLLDASKSDFATVRNVEWAQKYLDGEIARRVVSLPEWAQ
jgi:hypothetical protein